MSVELVTIKPLYKDIFDRYAIKERKIKFGKINLVQFYYANTNLVDENGEPEDIIDISSVLFRKDGDGHMTPYIYEFEASSSGGKPTGKVVKKGTIVHDFILFAKEAMGVTDIRTGKMKSGSLYPIQYMVCIPIILSCIRAEGTSHLLAGCRQLGKTTIINNLLAGFLGIFAPRYMVLQNGYFSLVTSSYKERSVEKAYENTKVNLEKAISIHNRMYPKTPLVTGKKYKKSDTATGKANAFTFDIGKIMNGNPILYTRVYAVSTGTDQDGLTCSLLVLDEPQLTDMEQFKAIAPFTDSVSGITLFTGIGSDSETDVASTYYRQSKVDTELIKTYRIPIPIHLNLIAHTSVDRFNSMLRAFYSKMLLWGGMNSIMSKKHYFASFSISNGKFLTKSSLKALDIQTLDYDVKKLKASKSKIVRRVCGLDLATISDYCVATTLNVYSEGMDNDSTIFDAEDAEFYYEYIDGITFNKERNGIDFIKVTSKQISTYCKEASIDILMVDSTSAEVSVDTIQNEITELGITTLVVPFKFSGMNKENMMWYFENVMFGGLLHLLKEDNELFSYTKLIEEMLYLIKSKSDRGKMEWKAPKGTTFTDDHVMSLAIAVYAIKYLISLQNKKRPIIKIGVKEIDPYSDRFIDVLGNRFKDVYEEAERYEPTFIDFF